MTITADTKLTLNEAVEYIASQFKQNKIFKKSKFTILAANNKMIIKSEALKNKGLLVEIKLDSPYEVATYSDLIVKFITLETQTCSMISGFNMQQSKYRPFGSRTDIKGGHYWGYDRCFHSYVPDFNLITNDICEYINFCIS